MNALPDWITPEWQKENNYISLRALDDGSVIGLYPLLFTLAIIMDIEPGGVIGEGSVSRTGRKRCPSSPG